MATNARFANWFEARTLPSLGLLVFRVVMGVAFIFHGWGKVQDPTGWMGDGAPAFVQAAAAFSEFGGGILLTLGLLTPLALLGIIGVMCGALFIVHLPAGDPFVSSGEGGSYELALVYLTAALMFLANSPGRFSLDYLFFGKPKG